MPSMNCHGDDGPRRGLCGEVEREGKRLGGGLPMAKSMETLFHGHIPGVALVVESVIFENR